MTVTPNKATEPPPGPLALAMDKTSSAAADVNTVLIAVDLPGQHTKIGIELRPSRMAAAWILWLTVTLLVIAFWLPSPRRRNPSRRCAALAGVSSVPRRRSNRV